jgi:succinyl-CoA synthetase alpha subunit
MALKGRIIKGKYFDSVTLMIVQKEMAATPGVKDAAIVMATVQNRAILSTSGLLLPEFAQAEDSDLLIAVQANDENVAGQVVQKVEQQLEQVKKKAEGGGEARPKSLDGALKLLPDANIALISVAGRYAGEEAKKALDKGLHVMLFSDNVSLETEIALKKYACDRQLLVMGPDCGTAIISGVPLAFANVVSRGHIGIVAASGTGLQEVSSIITNEGAGISQAIGTGGRDVKKEVGGLMFLQSLEALAEDEATQVILLVSKPPHADVLKKIAAQVAGSKKAVVAVFLGADPETLRPYDIHGARTLEEAALLAVALARGGKPLEIGPEVRARLSARDGDLKKLASGEAAKRKKKQKYVRGLFSGGTFCSEAQILLADMVTSIYSNAPTGKSKQLEDVLKSKLHTVIDLGEDEFCVGRPHPMIDYTLRCRRIIEEANDPKTAVILLDVVLGYGSHMDPATELVPVLREAVNKVTVVCSVTGTDRDPQNRASVMKRLTETDALVMPTNAAACQLAGYTVKLLEDR